VKIIAKLALSTLVLALAAAPLSRAQDNTVTVPVAPAPDASAPAPHAGKAGGKRLHDAMVQRDKELAEKLSLTDAQKQQLADLRKSQAESLKAARGDRAKMAELMKTSHDQVRALLTPEQQTKFDAMKPEGHAGKGGKKKVEQS
jgi:Spy/CpxP family protein refolding chaperone